MSDLKEDLSTIFEKLKAIQPERDMSDDSDDSYGELTSFVRHGQIP